MSTEIVLGVTSLVTSTIAGVLGLGGGMLLIAVMPSFLPAAWIIPVHGVTQLASNGSRALFAFKHVDWRLMWPFVVGSVCGVAGFGVIAATLPAEFVLLTIGTYILLTLWSQWFSRLIKRYETFYSAGFFQTGLGIVVGATGPLTNTLLAKQSNGKEGIIATSAVMMLLSHAFKVALFAMLGFVYSQHLGLIFAMVVGAITGSWIGTKLRKQITDERFILLFKIVLTMLAIKMLISGLVVTFF